MRRRDFLGAAASSAVAAWQLPWDAILAVEPPVTSGAAGKAERQAAAAPDPRTAATQAAYYWSWWGWEPMDHYRRIGGNAGAVDGGAEWVPQWFDRLHGEPLVQSMAQLGVNLAITHFFKGFGLRHERTEQQRTAELVRAAHRHGVRVLGYCQSRSLYYETFLLEEPAAEQWVQRDAAGKLRTWGGAYYRWTPCILGPEFRQYMKRAIRVGLEEIGLDGLHFDNDYCEPCYCPRCEQAFRRWLTVKHPSPRERFGLDSFAQVRLPPEQPSANRIQDPLVQEWIRFRCECLGDYHRDITSYARSLRPGAILMGNPAHPRTSDGPYRRSVWAPLVGRHLNLMFAENGNFPGMLDGDMVSQIRAYKQGAAVGYRVVSTTWRRGKESGLGLPETAAAVGLQIAEAAANGGVPGTNWALRPLADGDRMRIDRPDLRDALAKALRFVRDNEKLLAHGRPVRDVAVLQSFASLAFDARDAWSQVLAVEEVLIRAGFAWETVFGDPSPLVPGGGSSSPLAPGGRRVGGEGGALDGFAALVLAGHSHLSDREAEAIRAFVARGGGLVLVGENGRYDDNGRQRSRNALDGLEGQRVVRVDPSAVRTTPAVGYEVRVPLPKGWQKLSSAIEQAAGGRLSVRLHGPDTVALSAYEIPPHCLAVHLVNYAAPDSAQGLRLELSSRWKDCRTAQVRLLDGPPQELPITAATDRATVALPPVPLYAVVLLG